MRGFASKRETRDIARKETGKSRSRKTKIKNRDNGKSSGCYIACHIKLIIFNNYKFMFFA